jgi:hypothetical protein
MAQSHANSGIRNIASYVGSVPYSAFSLAMLPLLTLSAYELMAANEKLLSL